MTSEVLESIIDRCWTILPLMRPVVTELKNDSAVSATAGDLGRRLFPLAAGFKRCGQPIPGRLLLGLAEAFTELGLQNLTHSEQTIAVLQTALNEFSDRLVELDATGQNTILEPTDTIARLEAMVADQRTTSPAMIRSWDASPDIRPDPLTELRRCGDTLVSASESLLNRVQRDEASPYSPLVSRIHHLATTLRERLTEVTPSLAAANAPAIDVCKVSSESREVDFVIASESSEWQCSGSVDLEEHCSSEDFDAVARGSDNRSPRVLVIDESPFFRMLLDTAVEAAGYESLTMASLDQAEGLLNDSQSSDIVIWGGLGSSTETECLTDWILRREDSRRPMLIGLINGTQVSDDVPPGIDHLMPRAHLTELLGIVRGKLDDATHSIKKSA